jgi:hypothetical protein
MPPATKPKPAPLHVVHSASGQVMMARTLNDPALADTLAEVIAEMTSSKEASVVALKRIGILNRSGKLSKNFGGR